MNRSNLHLNKVGDRVLGKNICAYLKLIRIGYVNHLEKSLQIRNPIFCTNRRSL